MFQQIVRPALRSILQRIGTGAIHASSAPQYVSIQVFSNSVFILKGCTDTLGNPKFGIPFLLMSFPELQTIVCFLHNKKENTQVLFIMYEDMYVDKHLHVKLYMQQVCVTAFVCACL